MNTTEIRNPALMPRNHHRYGRMRARLGTSIFVALAFAGCGDNADAPDPIAGFWRSAGGLHSIQIGENLQGLASLTLRSSSGGDDVVADFGLHVERNEEQYHLHFVASDPDAAYGPYDNIAELPDDATMRLRSVDSDDADTSWVSFHRIQAPTAKAPGPSANANTNDSSTTEPERCRGSAPSSCSGTGRLSCEYVLGCSWTPDYRHGNYIDGDCDGSPKSCSSLHSDYECSNQRGCSWE